MRFWRDAGAQVSGAVCYGPWPTGWHGRPGGKPAQTWRDWSQQRDPERSDDQPAPTALPRPAEQAPPARVPDASESAGQPAPRRASKGVPKPKLDPGLEHTKPQLKASDRPASFQPAHPGPGPSALAPGPLFHLGLGGLLEGRPASTLPENTQSQVDAGILRYTEAAKSEQLIANPAFDTAEPTSRPPLSEAERRGVDEDARR